MKKVLVLFLFMLGAPVWAQTPIPSMPRAELSIGLFRVLAEVAATPEQRGAGLMWRSGMAAHEGMLFVFPRADRHCMWMKNTLIPLSVAFLDEKGRIINIRNMRPQSENNHCADAPARFALEMNRGWFAEKGIAPGAQVSGLNVLEANRAR
ncbi:MAG: DUF192 domain-containing protein [Zoogloeaceae bacterium]|jgi:uncharacterized membrane protein (UPF0127 family)|nr:DUF192 domain-containing protein [Zoogloeaceae bacterium]